jgi:hypothetical protein
LPIETSTTFPPKTYTFPIGKPTWLLVRSERTKDGKTMDKTFAQVRASLKNNAYFRSINWEDKAAKPIIDGFSLSRPPASVITDKHGHVVRKLEGARTPSQMVEFLKQAMR